MGLNHGPKKIPTTGLKFMLDAANRNSMLQAAQLSNILVDPHNWTVGTGGFSGYGANGTAAEQNRVLVTDDPWGGRSVTWRTTPDAVSDADGGWNTSYYSIDRSYTYRWSVWVRRYTSGTGGTFYMGLNPAPIRNDNNTLQSNPYFTYPPQSSLVLNQWYLVVGHCFYEGYSNGIRHPDSGWYQKTATGADKIPDLSYGNIGTQDCRWDPSTTTSMHRTYHYYTTNTASGLEFAYPRLDKCDGSEPSITELVTTGESIWRDIANTISSGYHGIIQNQTNVTWSNTNGGVLNFDATVDGSYINTNYNFTSEDYTIIVVSRYSGANRGRILSALNNNWLLGHHGDLAECYYANEWVRNTGSSNDQTWGIHVATRNAALDQTSYWKNGTKIINNSNLGNQGPNGFSIGRYAAGNSQYSNAQVGYLAGWNVVLTDSEIKDITVSLKNRFGI